MTRDTHTNYPAVTTCFYDFGLSRLGLEHPTFRLQATGLNIHTKIRILNSNIFSVLDESEYWKTCVIREKKLEVLQTKCLWRIFRPNVISN